MKSNSILSTADNTIDFIFPKTILNNISDIECILDEDKELFKKLIRECMKICKGKDLYIQDVRDLIINESPSSLTNNDKIEIYGLSRDFTKELVASEHRDFLEQRIEDIFLSGENNE